MREIARHFFLNLAYRSMLRSPSPVAQRLKSGIPHGSLSQFLDRENAFTSACLISGDLSQHVLTRRIYRMSDRATNLQLFSCCPQRECKLAPAPGNPAHTKPTLERLQMESS